MPVGELHVSNVDDVSITSFSAVSSLTSFFIGELTLLCTGDAIVFVTFFSMQRFRLPVLNIINRI